MSDDGWISLHRKIQDHWIWENPKYLKWWLDLLLMANHKENKVLVNGKVVLVGIGERLTSEQKLAYRWGVSRNTARKFLDLIQKDGMISIEKSRQSGTTYKVANYAGYQGISQEKRQRTEQQNEQPSEQRTEQQEDNELNINNNVNNANNVNKDNTKNIPPKNLLEERFNKLWEAYPNKKGKESAFKAYQKAVKDGVTDEIISDGIRRYCEEIRIKRTEQQFIAYGSSWFNQRRWEDDYSTTPQKRQTTYSDPRQEETE